MKTGHFYRAGLTIQGKYICCESYKKIDLNSFDQAIRIDTIAFDLSVKRAGLCS